MGATFQDQNGNDIIAIIVDGQVVEIGANPVLQEKTATPQEVPQRITPDSNYDALSAVNIDRIPEDYVQTFGNLNVTQNNRTINVSRFKTVTINIQPSYDPPSGGSGSQESKDYHSIIIGDKNTWDDWHLVPTSRPVFTMPSPKTNIVDIPGADGSLDLSTALTGRMRYSNRQGSFEFIAINDYGYWVDRYSDIANYLHGKTYKAILCDDPDYYYEGRFTVSEWKSNKNWSSISIGYNVGPYKQSVLSNGDKWLWDEFNLQVDRYDPVPTGPRDSQAVKDYWAGVIQSYKDIVVNDTVSGFTVVYMGDIYETEPVFTCSKYNNLDFNMTVTFEGANRADTLKLGTNVLYNRSFAEGANTLIFRGVGVVSIENTGGRL